MSIEEKLVTLRRQKGWSQEELAEQMGVSRQAVTKWESGIATPDLDKLIRLSDLYGVTLDDLVKGNSSAASNAENTASAQRAETKPIEESRRVVTAEEANTYLHTRRRAALPTAIGVFLCILSPITLILLAGLSDIRCIPLPEDLAAGIGLCTLFLLVAIAVGLFLYTGRHSRRFAFLEDTVFILEEREMFLSRQNAFELRYTRYNIIGAALCILSLVPLFIGMAIDSHNDMYGIIGAVSIFFLCGVGVFFFVLGGMVFGSYDKLLEIGDYTEKKKEEKESKELFSEIYWAFPIALFLLFGFLFGGWHWAWVLFPIAGVLYPAFYAIIRLISKR